MNMEVILSSEESTRNNRRTVGNGVCCALHAKGLYNGDTSLTLDSCKGVCEEKTYCVQLRATGQRSERRSWRISTVKNRYQETTSGDRLCAIVICELKQWVMANKSSHQSKPRLYSSIHVANKSGTCLTGMRPTTQKQNLPNTKQEL
jgi:CRISPR/Cas system CMR-associated protein Cmr1 (group 7 of RAMP superfamily)